MASERLTLFLCGDVMTGRGIDQALPCPVEPTLHEPSVHDARGYLRLAEQVSGPIGAPLAPDAIWGDALAELERTRPALRLINLETAITTSDQWRKEKGIHYRMHPANVACLTAAGIDGCVLANNHVLDWDHGGLAQSLATLRAAGLRSAGAGANAAAAGAPMTFETPVGRVRVFAFGSTDSGIPPGWSATPSTPGVNLLPDLSEGTAAETAAHIRGVVEPGDLVIVSIHWGGNWGDEIPEAHRRFAHDLIDAGAADLIHGHSSHHPRAMEVHRQRLVLYGCGDFINDYEGIAGHEAHRPDLRLMYLPTLEPRTGRLTGLRLVPMQARRFRLHRASVRDSGWLAERLDRLGGGRGLRLRLADDGAIEAEHPAPTRD